MQIHKGIGRVFNSKNDFIRKRKFQSLINLSSINISNLLYLNMKRYLILKNLIYVPKVKM